ncbi:MAG: DUF4386 family protein [Bacteroidales bacterium]
MNKSHNQLNSIYKFGAYSTIIALIGIFADVIIGNITGGNLTELPSSASERFSQFYQSKLTGLYNLDLLNTIVQIILIPAIFSLFRAHRNTDKSFAQLAFVLFLTGSIVMISNNVALPMMELSSKYFQTSAESQKLLYSTAGEALLAQGAHGSPGIFFGFFIPNLGNLLISIVMLRGGIFSKLNAWLGISGSILMLAYVVLVNFVPGIESAATAFAMPGGLLLMGWMILYTIRLFKL